MGQNVMDSGEYFMSFLASILISRVTVNVVLNYSDRVWFTNYTWLIET